MKTKIYTKGRLNDYEAFGVYDGKSVVVLKGSKISNKVASKINPVVIKKRSDKTLVSDSYVTLMDISFRSPSTAAAFVTGNISNGMRVWKVEEGMDLGKYKENNNG